MSLCKKDCTRHWTDESMDRAKTCLQKILDREINMPIDWCKLREAAFRDRYMESVRMGKECHPFTRIDQVLCRPHNKVRIVAEVRRQQALAIVYVVWGLSDQGVCSDIIEMILSLLQQY